MVLMKMDRDGDAVAAFRTVAGLEPKRADVHVNLGIALADTGDLQGALGEFTHAVRLDPRSGIARYNRGRVLRDLQRDAEAKAELETAVRLNANEAEWWSTLASIARTTDDKQEFLRGLRMAAALEPRSALRRSELGQALQETGDRNGAIAQWREALSIDPRNREALYGLSRALLRTQPEEAQRMQARLNDLMSLGRVTDESQTMGNDALNAAAAGDWTRAIAQLRAAIEKCGECTAGPLLHKDLGLVYCRSGDLKNGESELQEAKKMMPDDKDIARTLEIIGSHAR
jgi:tetratricopeptide (TPR) repeat protein